MKEVISLLEEIEWAENGVCFICKAIRPSYHRDDCNLAKALSLLKEQPVCEKCGGSGTVVLERNYAGEDILDAFCPDCQPKPEPSYSPFHKPIRTELRKEATNKKEDDKQSKPVHTTLGPPHYGATVEGESCSECSWEPEPSGEVREDIGKTYKDNSGYHVLGKKSEPSAEFVSCFRRVIAMYDPVPNSVMTEENIALKILVDWSRQAIVHIEQLGHEKAKAELLIAFYLEGLEKSQEEIKQLEAKIEAKDGKDGMP